MSAKNEKQGYWTINKLLAVSITFVVSTILADVYHTNCLRLEEYNPFKLKKARQSYLAMRDSLFSPNGLADANSDGAISFDERVAAYRRMGFTNYFAEGDENHDCFPYPTFSQLKTAVDSLRTERSR